MEKHFLTEIEHLCRFLRRLKLEIATEYLVRSKKSYTAARTELSSLYRMYHE
jgi:hypothetical protein